jgi:hypothetical protein
MGDSEMTVADRFKELIFSVTIACLWCSVCALDANAETKAAPIKAIETHPKQQLQLVVLPDLVVDRIELDGNCSLIVTIRNAGSGTIPADQHAQGLVRVYVGTTRKDFQFGPSSNKKVDSIDQNGLLRKADGTLSFNTGITVAASVKVSAYADYTKKITESNDENNRSNAVTLTPNCLKAQKPLSKMKLQRKPDQQQTSSKVTVSDKTVIKPVETKPATAPRVVIPPGAMRAMPGISQALDLGRRNREREFVVLRGQNFGDGPDGRQVRLLRLNTAGAPVNTYFLTVRNWNSNEIIADMPDSLVNPSNPAERYVPLTERAGQFTVGLYRTSDNQWLSNQVPVEAGQGRDMDADGDGSIAVRFRGDDCDDNDPERYPGNFEVGDFEGHDEDCDPVSIGTRDEDGDGYTDDRVWNDPVQFASTSGLHEGYRGNDCDDSRADVHPGQVEVCNGRDDNCNGQIDEGVTTTVYHDEDRDLYGDPSAPEEICYSELRSGLVTNSDDCDDTDPTINPREGNCP